MADHPLPEEHLHYLQRSGVTSIGRGPTTESFSSSSSLLLLHRVPHSLCQSPSVPSWWCSALLDLYPESLPSTAVDFLVLCSSKRRLSAFVPNLFPRQLSTFWCSARRRLLPCWCSAACRLSLVEMDELLQNHLFATHAIAASGSVVFGTALTYPLDTIKSLIQVGSGSSKQLTAYQVIKRVRALSGYSGLYSGFEWLAWGKTFGMAARFGIYEVLTAFYKDGREDNFVHVSEALMAGMAAGAVESVASTPFELIKLRGQVTSASRFSRATPVTENKAVMPATARLLRGYTPDMKALNHAVGMLSILNSKHPNMVGAIRQYPWMMTGSGRPPSVYDVRRPSEIISLEGWGALWRGLRSGVARDSVFGGIFFSTWECLHQVMLNWKAVGMDPPPRYDEEIGPLSPLAVSLAAGLSGSVAAAASHGFDTAKSRSQCIVLPKFISMERKLLKWKTPGKRFEKLTGIHPADRNLLFRGIWLRMARSGISSFAIMGSYYFSITYLVSSN